MGKQQEDETNSLDKNSSAPVNKLAQEMWKPSADPIHTFCFSTRFWCRRATCSSYCKSTQQQGTALQTVQLVRIKHTPSLHTVQQHSHYTLCNNTVTTHCTTTWSLHTVQQHSHYTLCNNTVTTHCATTQSLHTVQQHGHYTLCNNTVTTHCNITVTTHCATTQSLHTVQQHSHYTLCNNRVTTHCATTQSLHAAWQHFNPITAHCTTTQSLQPVQQQFSSKWYVCAQKSPYVLHLISLKFSQQRLRLT